MKNTWSPSLLGKEDISHLGLEGKDKERVEESICAVGTEDFGGRDESEKKGEAIELSTKPSMSHVRTVTETAYTDTVITPRGRDEFGGDERL